MIAKLVEIRDAATFIVALAIRLESLSESDRYLLARSGYGLTSVDHGAYVMLAEIGGGEGRITCDPHDWRSRTWAVAHEWLIRHFDDLEPGGVVDVEHILGLRATPKRPEREEAL